MTTDPYPDPLSPGVLQDLEAWGRLSGWARQHVRAVERFYVTLGRPRPFRILDVSCGLGGMLEDIWLWGKKNDVELVLAGVDRRQGMVERARARLVDRALIAQGDPLRLQCEPQAWHLTTCTLGLNALSGPDRVRLIAEMGRAAQTAYLFDVTPSAAAEVGARLIPWLLGLQHAPPEAWVHTLERAPSLQELTELVAPLPVEVHRVFPAAMCTLPEGTPRVKIRTPEARRVVFPVPDVDGLPDTGS